MKGIIVLILALVAFQSVKAEDLAPQNTACDACQYVVGLVENYIDANYTVDEITNFLEQWCSYVPQFGQMCDQIVQYGVQDFIAYIETNEAPDTFCKQVQLCNSVVLAEPTQGSNCAICEYVITLVENYVTSNTTIDEFVSVLDNYCSMVPGLAQVCDQLVQYGVDDLLAYIQADLSPQQVCTLAKLCTSEQKEVEVPAVTPTLGDNCSTCTFVVSLIESYVENNGTINQIIADVEKACSIIPGIQPICDQLVAAGIQQIINYINQDLSPTQICTLLKLCSSQAEAVPSTPVVAVAQVGDATCDTCQYVVTIIESYVEDNATVEEIEEKLQAACNVIPGIGPICQEFIDYGIQEIVNYINANLSPLQVCTLMKLCGNEVAVMAPSDSNCDLCKYVVGIVEEWLESNATIAQAVTRLDALCTYVPGFEAVCEQVVEMGVQEFVTYIQTNEQPETVCTQIGLCTSRTCGKKAPVMQTRVKTL